MEPPGSVELPLAAYRTATLRSVGGVVTSRGIEPRSLGLQPSAMTTPARWSDWSRRRESNPRLRVTRAPCCRQHFVDRNWSRRRESNPHAGAYGAPKVTVPSLRKCEIDGLAGGPGGIRTLVSWVQTTDPAAERRAHPGEDNGTRTRTPALTTRRLPLRLCPPRDGRLAGIRTPICTV
jgi:hypothetical protein